jgi:hypothetical protein
MGDMHNEPFEEARMEQPTAIAAAAPGTAVITALAAARSGISMQAAANYDDGIGRIDFVLIDLTSDPLANVVERKDIEYSKSRRAVTEGWTSSVPLTPKRQYRAFVHVYDRSGVNLVAYDRRDFSYEEGD